MALLPCRECTIPVSTQANICPHCGIRKPLKRKSTWGQSTLIGLAITVVFFMWITGSLGGSDEASHAPQQAADMSPKIPAAKTSAKVDPAPINTADASNLHYDANYVRNEQTFNQLIVEAKLCMRQSAQAQLMTGERNRESIIEFMTSTCGAALSYFMTDTLVQPKVRVQLFIAALANKELDTIPGVSHSSAGAQTTASDLPN